jgi:hypothetical protein
MTTKELQDKIVKALENMMTLQIVTVVGTYDSATNAVGTNSKMMRTSLNLLLGNKVTEVDEAFVTGPFAPLRDYHAQAEQGGHAIFSANLEILEKLLGIAGRLGA